VAGHTELVNAVKCPIYQSHISGAKYPFKPLKEGSTIRVGKALVKFIETPGHTPDGMCGLVYGPDNQGVPELIFTGDVVFVGSVGRPDLMGGATSAAWLASAFSIPGPEKYPNLITASKFSQPTEQDPFAVRISPTDHSVLSVRKKSNPYLQYKKRGEFIAALLQDLPEAPQYFGHNAAMNKNGPPLIDWDAGLLNETAPDMALTDPGKTYVVDLRSADKYAKGHIPNS